MGRTALVILILIARHSQESLIKIIRFITHKSWRVPWLARGPHREIVGGEGERGCEPQALLSLGFTSGVPRALRFTLLANLKHKSRNVSMGKEKRGHSRNSYLGDPGLSKRGASWAGAPRFIVRLFSQSQRHTAGAC